MRAAERIGKDKGLQRVVMDHCRQNPVDWMVDWVWTYDPRLEGQKSIPFLLFPRQVEYIEWRRDLYGRRESGLVEKTRDVGLTWLNVADQLHHWLFEPQFKGTFGSRKEALVDQRDNPDSIFAKMRHIIAWLPRWMMPPGWNPKAHDKTLVLTNPATGAAITGEGGDNMGRGGRSSLYDLDEFAFVERADTVDMAVSQNSDCRIYTSTANGQGNAFHRKRFSGAVPVFTFNWRDDPRKGDAWYQRQVDTLDPTTVAQEIDIDYSASVDRVIIPRGWIEPAITRMLYPTEPGAITIGGDLAEGGRDKCGAVVRQGRNILHLSEWSDPEARDSAGHFIELGKRFETQMGDGHKIYLMLDAIGVGAGTLGAIRRWLDLPENAERKRRWVVVGVKASEKTKDTKCYRLRDAMWWRLREWFKGRLPALAPDIPRTLANKLATEASSVTYRPNDDGLIVVESKDKLAARGIHSPDLADALIHTFAWEAVNPAKDERPGWVQRQQASTGMVV